MSKRQFIAASLLLSAAGLLALLVLPPTIEPAERIVAVVLLAALFLLFALYVRIERQAAQELTEANPQLEKKTVEIDGKLSDSEVLLQSIMDGLPDPVIILDKDFGVTSINKVARRALDINNDGSEPATCYRTFHGLDAPCDPSIHSCVLKTGESYKEIQTKIGEDGRKKLIELRATPLFDEFGEITGAVGVLHDLNEQEKYALKLQRAIEDAETADRARTEFVATMSHEVRTPMNAVLGMADLLRLTALTRKQKSYVQILESSSNMLLSFVDNMIDFATLESGDLVLKNESFHVTDILERVFEIMGYQACSKGLELAGATEKDPDIQVIGDFERLRQIMINLVSNAIKFTDEGEVIVNVGVDTDSDNQTKLLVSVADSGIGMAENAAARLFAPFTSVTNRVGNDGRGSGLGLAITKQLVDLMGGEISIESQPGRGTTVSFSVPVERVARADVSVTESRRALSNRRLLILNDNPKVSATICSFLNAWNVCCDVETNADRVANRLAAASDSAYPYDCVVVDIDAKKADNLSLARAIRKQGDLPLLLLTSIAQPLEVGGTLSIGRTRCVNKPVLPSEFRHNLFKLFEVDVADSLQADADLSRSLRILIAEDNPINRYLLRNLLRSMDFDVDAVEDGPSVLSALREKSYELILMDCQMPGMDGDKVTRIIRKGMERDSGQPVIVAVTAHVSEKHREKCLRAGMDDFLAKPVRLDTLKSGLRRWSFMADSRRVQSPAATATSFPEGDAIRERLLDRTSAVSDEVVDEFIDLFLDDTASRIEVLQTALQQKDLKTMRRECHALKGACLELGISGLGSCCDELRQASRDKRLDDLPSALHRLTAEFARVKPVFEAEKNRPV
ncbi:MAG: response regulator [Gammaproteobacteria bacterium]|nr:response regulator [Gammaproteobacteria bacterium]